MGANHDTTVTRVPLKVLNPYLGVVHIITKMNRHAMRLHFLLHVTRIILPILLVVEGIAATGEIRRVAIQTMRRVAVKATVMEARIAWRNIREDLKKNGERQTGESGRKLWKSNVCRRKSSVWKKRRNRKRKK